MKPIISINIPAKSIHPAIDFSFITPSRSGRRSARRR
jgi:hypothetical protein